MINLLILSATLHLIPTYQKINELNEVDTLICVYRTKTVWNIPIDNAMNKAIRCLEDNHLIIKHKLENINIIIVSRKYYIKSHTLNNLDKYIKLIEPSTIVKVE